MKIRSSCRAFAILIPFVALVASCADDASSLGADAELKVPDCHAEDDRCDCSLERDGNENTCATIEPGVCCAEPDWPDDGECSCHVPGGTCTVRGGDFCSCWVGNDVDPEEDEYVVRECPASLQKCCDDGSMCFCSDNASGCDEGETRVAACPVPDCGPDRIRVSACN